MIQSSVKQTDFYKKPHFLTTGLNDDNETPSNSITKSNISFKNQSQKSCSSCSATKGNLPTLPNCVKITRMSMQILESVLQLTPKNMISTIENTTTSTCYPLSPQLLNCPLIYYDKNCYKIDSETQQLHILNSNYYLELGDYFIDQRQGKVFLCSEPLPKPVKSPRCNYITLDTGQFTILGNGSLYINESHTLIQRPIYSPIDQNFWNVCFPLSITFLNCPESLLYVVRDSAYNKLSRMRLFYRSHNQVVEPSEYYQYNSANDVVVCVSQKSMKVCNLLLNFYVVIDCLSTISLIFLTLYHLLVPQQLIYKVCLIGHSATMTSYYISVILERIISGHDYLIMCYILFFLKYFSLTSAYTWLTVLGFDICCSFSSLTTSYCQCLMLKERRERHAILIYSIIGWGLPCVMCILVAVVEWDTSLQKSLSVYPDAFGSCKCLCWLSNHFALFALHYGYDMCLSTTNIILYIITVYNIRHGNKQTKTVNSNRRKQM